MYKDRVNKIKAVAGQIKAGWRDVSKVLVECIKHFDENSRDGILIAKLHNALNVENGNKSMAKAIKKVTFEYYGVTVGKNADGSDRSKNSKEQYNTHTDAERESVLASLEAGGLSDLFEALKQPKGSDKAEKADDLGFKLTKEMKASPEFKVAAKLAHTFYEIKEVGGYEDEELQAMISDIEEMLSLAEQHLKGLQDAKKTFASKMAGEDKAAKAA